MSESDILSLNDVFNISSFSIPKYSQNTSAISPLEYEEILPPNPIDPKSPVFTAFAKRPIF